MTTHRRDAAKSPGTDHHSDTAEAWSTTGRRDPAASQATPHDPDAAASQPTARHHDATESPNAARHHDAAESPDTADRHDAAKSPSMTRGGDALPSPITLGHHDTEESHAVYVPPTERTVPESEYLEDEGEPSLMPVMVKVEPPHRPRRQAEDANKRAFHRADALLAIVQTYVRGDRPHRAPIDVVVTIPLSSLRAGAVDPTDAGVSGDSYVSPEAARRLSCDAGAIEVIEDDHGAPLSVGRKRRTIAGSLKRALLKRDTACTFPGCTHRVFLEGHHIQHWADGGETSMKNTCLLCSLHHRHVHEYGYTIELTGDQRPQFRDPHGRIIASVPAMPDPEDLGWPHLHAANEALAIDAETIAHDDDGGPMPYDTLVSYLAQIDKPS